MGFETKKTGCVYLDCLCIFMQGQTCCLYEYAITHFAELKKVAECHPHIHILHRSFVLVHLLTPSSFLSTKRLYKRVSLIAHVYFSSFNSSHEMHRPKLKPKGKEKKSVSDTSCLFLSFHFININKMSLSCIYYLNF